MSIEAKVRLARGPKSRLPTPPNSFELGRPYVAEDTKELWIGQGLTVPMIQVGFSGVLTEASIQGLVADLAALTAADATETARAEAAEAATLTTAEGYTDTGIAAEVVRADASYVSVYAPQVFIKNYQISADVTAGQVVSMDSASSNVVSPCTSTRIPLGIAQQDGLFANHDQIDVCIAGVSPINATMAGNPIRAGDILAVNDLGQVIIAVPAPGKTIRTIGLSVDADDGPLDTFIVLVAPGSVTGDSVAALSGAVTTAEAYTDSSIAAIPAAHNYTPDIAAAVGTETTRATGVGGIL